MSSSGTFVIPSAFTAIDKFSGPMKAMGNAVNGFVGRSERLLGRANIAFTKLLTPISNLNRMLMGLGYYVGLFTLVRIIKNAIDIFADFEQANADLAVVMGITVKQNKILASDARRVGLAYGEGATGVVKMQHALATLGFEQSDILKMGRPLITGSAALEGADPEKLAGTVGAVINAFENLGAGDTQHILDVMALSANRTALNFEKLATTIPIVAGPANAVGISFEEMIALLGVLSNAGVHVATSATSLKNIFIDSAKRGHTYSQVIENISKNANKLTYANKLFGKRSVVSALAITQKMHDAKNGVIALTEEFKNAKLGLTEAIAIQRLNTFRGAQKLLNAAYEEFVLSIEDGNGSLAQSLTRILRVGGAMLLLSSNSDQAREAVAKIAPDILKTAESWLGWLKIIAKVTAGLIAMRIALWVWRGVVIAATIAQTALSVALGIGTAAGWANVWALRGNVVALTTLRTVTWLSTAAQTAWNYALKVNPVFLMATAIVALTEAYYEFNRAIAESKKPLEEQLKNQFKDSQPWYMKFGWGEQQKHLQPAYADSVENRAARRWSGEENDSIQKINPKAARDSEIDSIIMNVLKGRMQIDINDPGKHVNEVKSDSSWIAPRVTNTNGW